MNKLLNSITTILFKKNTFKRVCIHVLRSGIDFSKKLQLICINWPLYYWFFLVVLIIAPCLILLIKPDWLWYFVSNLITLSKPIHIFLCLLIAIGLIYTWFEIYRKQYSNDGDIFRPKGHAFYSSFIIFLGLLGLDLTTSLGANKIQESLKNTLPSIQKFYANHDQSRLVGQTIRMMLLKIKEEEKYHEVEESIESLADYAIEGWIQLVDSSNSEDQAIIRGATESNLAIVLLDRTSIAIESIYWEKILNKWSKSIGQKVLSSEDLANIAKFLSQEFASSLRESVKIAYLRGNKSWPAFQIDIANVIVNQIKKKDVLNQERRQKEMSLLNKLHHNIEDNFNNLDNQLTKLDQDLSEINLITNGNKKNLDKLLAIHDESQAQIIFNQTRQQLMLNKLVTLLKTQKRIKEFEVLDKTLDEIRKTGDIKVLTHLRSLYISKSLICSLYQIFTLKNPLKSITFFYSLQ